MKIPVNYISEAFIRSRVETYQTDATGNSGRKCVEHVDGWAQPLGQSLIAAVRFVKLSDLILKDSEYGVSRVAILQLRGEGMGEKVLLGLFLVGLERGLKDILEARGSRGFNWHMGHGRKLGRWMDL